MRHNPYAFYLTEVDNAACTTISHEIFDTLADEDTDHGRYFDYSAPAMKHVYFAKKTINGTYDPSGYTIDSKGVAHFPPLLNKSHGIPYFFAFVEQEAADPVSRSSLLKFNSFLVNGQSISNYATKQSFDCYDLTPKIYDRMGHMQYPCIPYGGVHQDIILINTATGITYDVKIDNFGPLNGTQINIMYGYGKFYPNFPPNTAILTILDVRSPDSSLNKKNVTRKRMNVDKA